jgi:hypothetical protein
MIDAIDPGGQIREINEAATACQKLPSVPNATSRMVSGVSWLAYRGGLRAVTSEGREQL